MLEGHVAAMARVMGPLSLQEPQSRRAMHVKWWKQGETVPKVLNK